MINPQWLELPMSRTNFHGPKDVRAIEVQLYDLHHGEVKGDVYGRHIALNTSSNEAK